ncbi:KTSC domain-containing protein [Pedobacter yonginense]|uniref:KTSC domain-containing protein n=1 Tax=Pedobacter yonginense TaxID=651869 RepID=A0A317ERV1_9SPHI|nr:KTSC domain-containing protein [Pedobacter yonginense]PWS29135.1 KTSC domain-containing protein [Pedobacter yonginense]
MPSSVISHFSYDATSKSLTITFVTGMVYQYKNVPLKTFEMLKSSVSKGRYFNHFIKKNFKFKKVKTA